MPTHKSTPGLLAEAVDRNWLAMQEVVRDAVATVQPDAPVYMTIAVGATALRQRGAVHEILLQMESTDVEGAYLVLERPAGAYLPADPMWFACGLELIAGLALQGKRVVVGYAGHPFLMAAAAGAAAIGAGSWQNVRAFTTTRFQAPRPGQIRRRATWYYWPAALSEFSLPFLDIAHNGGFLSSMVSGSGTGNPWCQKLVAGGQPSTTGFREPDSFAHYLDALRGQASAARRPTFDATIATSRSLLDVSDRSIVAAEANGIFGRQRSFADSSDACRSALLVLERGHGALLRRARARLPR